LGWENSREYQQKAVLNQAAILGMDMNEQYEYGPVTSGQGVVFQIAEDALKPLSFAYCSFLLIATAAVIALNFLTSSITSPELSIRPAVVLYFTILFFYLWRRLRDNRANIMAPDVAFVLLYTVFHMGYLFFWFFKIVPWSKAVFYSDLAIPGSMFVVNLGLVGFLLGYEVSSKLHPVPSGYGGFYVPKPQWAVFAWIFMVAGVLMHVSVIFMVGLSAFRTEGYSIVWNMRELYGALAATLWDNSMRVILMGTVAYCLYSALRYGRLFASKWAAFFPGLFLLMVAMEGDRGPVLMVGAPILLIQHYFVRPIKWRWLFLIGFSAMIIFWVVGKGRAVAFSPVKMIEIFFEQKAAGGTSWVDPFVEMGGSWKTVNMTLFLVPGQEPYWHGTSWLQAMLKMIPYLEGYLASKFGFTFAHAPAGWLTETIFWRGAAGTGFSIAAEGYLNFGYAGAFMELFVIAVLMHRVFIMFGKKPSPISAFVLLTLMGLLLRLPRASIGEITPYVFQAALIAIFLKIFFGIENAEESYSYEDVAEQGEYIERVDQ
jgi:hypothetical protein